MNKNHPVQNTHIDKKGTLRFVSNGIVEYLLEHGDLNVNYLGMMGFTREDWVQFYQLIGYSVSGFGGLNKVQDSDIAAAEASINDEPQTGVFKNAARTQQEEIGKALKTLYEVYEGDFEDLLYGD